ncbi:hypothetical protein [Mesorhizobium sp. WSM4315]|uniref:hypothetical protein n=1 Tax=Mesorhizobium sp. WSM4315 TaxID=2589882 RepID=UPI001AED1433|nr:hypothetical protein [Mesorhizobium sp. WSM4315]
MRTLAVIVPSLGVVGGGVAYVYNFAVNYRINKLETHTSELKEYLSTTVQGTFLAEGTTPVYWRADQAYDRGDTRCKGAVSFHQELRSQLNNQDLIDDRHKLQFDFVNAAEIVVSSDIFPEFTAFHLQAVSVPSDGYRVSLIMKGMDVDDMLEEKRDDKVTKLFSKDYRYHFLVISKKRALAVAADLKAVAEICGADAVRSTDMTAS